MILDIYFFHLQIIQKLELTQKILLLLYFYGWINESPHSKPSYTEPGSPPQDSPYQFLLIASHHVVKPPQLVFAHLISNIHGGR